MDVYTRIERANQAEGEERIGRANQPEAEQGERAEEIEEGQHANGEYSLRCRHTGVTICIHNVLCTSVHTDQNAMTKRRPLPLPSLSLIVHFL